MVRLLVRRFRVDPSMAAVPDFEELNRATTVGCVGGEDLMPFAVDRVEQRQLRTRVRTFPAADQPRAGRK
ncbi:hypothetical protein Acsp02_97100 [Actinoplanes sp. NBRC 103695]|nr:hypothetical protein Acsp02_97100 [Actinoplanes sp. NBRC 103695]